MSSAKGNSRSAKDKMMASHLKERGVTRTTGQCPSCHGTISNGKVHTFRECERVVFARKFPHKVSIADRRAAAA